MSTKLEAMVGLLAGRKVEPGLLDELADPSSEASRFFEATRVRSKALFAEPEGNGPTPSGRGRRIALTVSIVAALAFLAATLWLADRRLRLLETSLTARDVEARAESRRLEAILEKLAEPRPEPIASLKDAQGRIEAELARIARSAEQSKGEPGVMQVREDLALIRLELAAAEKAGVQRAEEVRASVHDAARVLRLLLNRLDPSLPVPEPVPGFTPPRPSPPVDPRRLKP